MPIFATAHNLIQGEQAGHFIAKAMTTEFNFLRRTLQTIGSVFHTAIRAENSKEKNEEKQELK